jgi:hypothetical protein
VKSGLELLLPAVLMLTPADLAADESGDSTGIDTIVVRPGISHLVLPSRYYRADVEYLLSQPARIQAPNLSGFEFYRISRMRSTLEGAGMGATDGLMAGAFGEMAGAWDERSSWYIAGAMAAFGALYGGGIKADDENWNLRIRLAPK